MSFTNTYNIPVPTFEFGNSAEIFTDICAALDDLNIQNQINQKQNVLEAGITYVQCGNIQATSILDDGKLTCNGGLLASEAIVIDQSLFPPNDEVDLLEVTDLLNFLFPDDNTLINLEELLAVKGIEMPEEDKNKILPIIDKILKFVRQVKTII